jgi:hypothetical protein
MDEKLEKLTPTSPNAHLKKLSYFARSGTMGELDEVVPTSTRIWILNHM